MKCALCHQDKKLCNSHIIPEFFYKPLYDKKHRLNVIPLSKEEKRRYEQKGLRESLLCKECEEQLSKYEKYASQFLNGGTGFYITNGNPIKIEGIDYEKFKLFQLSLLFRASVSNLGFFENIDLGPHEEKIRKMLINENPGKKSDYPCIIIIPKMKGEPVSDDFIGQPVELNKQEGHRQYRFILGGCFWLYLVSSHTIMSSLESFFLDNSGKLLIPIANADNYFRELARNMFSKND
ncbi:hypothetical protein KAW48_06880 [candidate division WOR-3 bacterium]|nr:hypothetical protein [candidate division WOR-3 bacterium]